MPELSGAPGLWVFKRHVVNQLTLVGSNGIDAAGVGKFQIGVAPAGLFYEVERLVVNTVNCADFSLYAVDINSVTSIREHALVTADPVLVFDESSLIRFFPNEAIFVVCTGGTAVATPVSAVLQIQVVTWRPTFIPDEIGPGVVITRGLEHNPDSDSPDPGGWN